jgi:hypothetical protein
MNAVATLPDPEEETRRQAAYRRLRSVDPRCVVCGEDDWRCLELHHVAGGAYDDLGAILCRNCHRKQGDPATNGRRPTDPPILERAGQFCVGLAALLAEIVTRLRAYGRELLEGAAVCPWPYGWVGAPVVA